MTVEDELNLLREQVKQIPMLLETMKGLQKQVRELQDRLVKDSHKSRGRHPGNALCAREKPKPAEEKRQKVGGQPGHPGQALELSATSDQVIVLAPVTHCQHCQAHLSSTEVQTVERRQVIDVPQPRAETIEYQADGNGVHTARDTPVQPFQPR